MNTLPNQYFGGYPAIPAQDLGHMYPVYQHPMMHPVSPQYHPQFLPFYSNSSFQNSRCENSNVDMYPCGMMAFPQQQIQPWQIMTQPQLSERSGNMMKKKQLSNSQKIKQNSTKSPSRKRADKENTIVSTGKEVKRPTQINPSFSQPKTSRKQQKARLFERLYNEHTSLKKKKEDAEEKYYSQYKIQSKKCKPNSKHHQFSTNENTITDVTQGHMSKECIYVQAPLLKGGHESFKQDQSIFDQYMDRALSSPKFKTLEEVQQPKQPFSDVSLNYQNSARQQQSVMNQKEHQSMIKDQPRQRGAIPKPRGFQYQSLFEKVKNASQQDQEKKSVEEQERIKKEQDKKVKEEKVTKAKTCFNQLLQKDAFQPNQSVTEVMNSRLRMQKLQQRTNSEQSRMINNFQVKPQHLVFYQPSSTQAKQLKCEQIDVSESMGKSKDSLDSQETVYHTNYQCSKQSMDKTVSDYVANNTSSSNMGENIANRLNNVYKKVNYGQADFQKRQQQEVFIQIEENRSSLQKQAMDTIEPAIVSSRQQQLNYNNEEEPFTFKNLQNCEIESFSQIDAPTIVEDSRQFLPQYQLSRENLELLQKQQNSIPPLAIRQKVLSMDDIQQRENDEATIEKELNEINWRLESQRQPSKLGSVQKKSKKKGYIPFSVRMASAKSGSVGDKSKQ